MKLSDDLRQSVLQAAVEGKLTKQYEKDGNAIELVNSVSKNMGKIQGINKDEVPFDIPKNWVWTRLGQIGESNIGLTYKPANKSNDGIPVLRSNNIQNGKMDYSNLIKVDISVNSNKIVKNGDLLICARNGSRSLVGKSAIIDDKGDGMSFGAFMAVYRSDFNPYVYIFLNSYAFRGQLDDAKTTTINQITQKMIKNQIIPLPPLAEQHRIVEKVDMLMAEIDELEKKENELEKLKKEFPEDMKASLLQAAMEGKLTKQLKEDGNADDLLKAISEEKEKLIKEKKIKKTKPLPEISEDDIPFDIPDNWKWVRLSSVISLLSGADLLKSQYNSSRKGIPYITGASNIIGSKVLINRWTLTPKNIANKGDLLLTCKGTVGKIAVLNEEKVHIARQIMALTPIIINKYFLKYYLELNVDSLKKSAKSMIPGIDRNTVLSSLFPLPPLAEQHRIVEKLDELLPLCEELKEDEDHG